MKKTNKNVNLKLCDFIQGIKWKNGWEKLESYGITSLLNNLNPQKRPLLGQKWNFINIVNVVRSSRDWSTKKKQTSTPHPNLYRK